MTVVEAEPVFDEKGSLIGAFSVERDMKSVKTQLQVLHEVEAILMRHLTEDFTSKVMPTTPLTILSGLQAFFGKPFALPRKWRFGT